MTACFKTDRLRLGGWVADRMTGRVEGPGRSRSLEPKVMDLLFLLAAEPGKVVPRGTLQAELWPDVTVGEDSLARCVFKLRGALRDGPDEAAAIETISKRGYRLVLYPPGNAAEPGRRGRRPWSLLAATASLLLTAAAVGLSLSWPGRADGRQQTLDRAQDAYFQYSLAENEAAAELFKRVLADDPGDAQALAGLSSVLVQRVLRWPDGTELRVSGSRLQAALRSGRLTGRVEREQLGQALRLAEKAVLNDPEDPDVQRSYGLALAALDRRVEAAAAYDRAISADSRAWGAMINRADLFDFEGRRIEALDLMERAYDSMNSGYREQPARIRPWLAAVGTDIARQHLALGDSKSARLWLLRTVHDNPQASEARHLLAELRKQSKAED